MSVEAYLAQARGEIERVDPFKAHALVREGALLVDIRPYYNRLAEGEIPGAIPIERIVLEWRLDPAGSHRLPDITADRVVIVFCNEGYASSLAARDLRRIGLRRATDLIGGFRAWEAEGLPVVDGGSPAVT
ncbi:rhodanese-like domain-containing protein [Actinokineospora sp. UTMC 2448]|uniref:rhodanese-like domain-containing protein n=1 Tax=Actinokineospora sp. UTMC 2448 TaxID=2268449 RepID=UPI002164C120|nr:rhodanese-like domain-containing protein [Actinokineospora sp. UTMC 2448]UVS80702.1 molybdopterin biosynthesis protein MoeB [Actinokineospora sp. UTMC 2448]